MDIYNRYLMRPSGERKHQAQTAPESATFAVMDLLRSEEKLPAGWDQMGETERNKLMEKMCDYISRSIEDFRP